MSCDHRRPEGFARACAAIPPTHMPDILGNSEQTIDRGRGMYCRARIAWEREVLGNELDPLTSGRPTLTCGGDRGVIGRVTLGGRDAGHCLCGATAQTGQQAEDEHDGATQSRSVPLRAAPGPGL